MSAVCIKELATGVHHKSLSGLVRLDPVRTLGARAAGHVVRSNRSSLGGEISSPPPSFSFFSSLLFYSLTWL